ncbi:MAG: hypothetical protein L0170_00840 [Acidobacteria bacterium]|nr:hypothetical protein [Acidobacteriota bacterium]
MDPSYPSPPPVRRRPKWAGILLILVVAGVAGYFLVRKFSGSSVAPVSVAKPASDVLVPGSSVLLTAKAAIVADRYNCLCGDCSDTLGKCTCARDQGSNEMKATLNRFAAEKKSVPEIDSAMVEKYGSKVLASEAPPPVPPSDK